MIEDELLEQRLHDWNTNRKHCDVLNSVDLASRVRNLRSARIHRSRAIVASLVLMFAGISLYLSTSRFRIRPESDLAQQLDLSNGAGGTEAAESDQELNNRMGQLHVQVEQTRQQTELLIMNLRIQQARFDADRFLRECQRQTLREQLASKWLIASFREMAAPDSQ